MENIK